MATFFLKENVTFVIAIAGFALSLWNAYQTYTLKKEKRRAQLPIVDLAIEQKRVAREWGVTFTFKNRSATIGAEIISIKAETPPGGLLSDPVPHKLEMMPAPQGNQERELRHRIEPNGEFVWIGVLKIPENLPGGQGKTAVFTCSIRLMDNSDRIETVTVRHDL